MHNTQRFMICIDLEYAELNYININRYIMSIYLYIVWQKLLNNSKTKKNMIKFCAKTIIQKPGAKRLPRGLVLLCKVLNACKISPTKNTEGRLRNWESYWKNYKEEGFKGLRECEGGKKMLCCCSLTNLLSDKRRRMSSSIGSRSLRLWQIEFCIKFKWVWFFSYQNHLQFNLI